MNVLPLLSAKYVREITRSFHPEALPDYESRCQHIAAWIRSIENGTVTRATESELQDDFLKTFFAHVLGYQTKVGQDKWELDYEFSTKQDATHADGYLGFFTPDEKDVRVVIELKDARSDLDAPQRRKQDRRTPVEQAFSYAHKSGSSCRWVIVSNMVEIRLYHAGDSTRFETFYIPDLLEEENLRRFLFLMDRRRLIRENGEAEIDLLYRERREHERELSNEFYDRFSSLRLQLFTHLVQHNPSVPELDLFGKAQKLLDRIVFVFFCEDTGMLPRKITQTVINSAAGSFSVGHDTLWQQLRGLFHSIDKGNPRHEINQFNGGLFADDPLLDSLMIQDDMLQKILGLEEFDFESDLDVNILGHIFEQSISDIEETKAKIAGNEFDEKKGKRKREGVFYTPPFITGYIVEKALGTWLDDRKRELGFDDLPELEEKDYASIKQQKNNLVRGNANVERHRAFWEAYREAVSNVTVLDPACGSGAFLIALFDRLYREGQAINQQLGMLSLGQTTTFDLDTHILRNNIYGVDLNPESVEITKLSLWLKTADKSAQLTALDDRIRVGNSIVHDPNQTHATPFQWEQAFPDVFANGGFDIVVGNPPYVRQELLGDVKDWLKDHYHVYAGTADLYVYFFERGITLLKPNGIFSIVVANKWMRGNYGKPLRGWLAEKRIEEIVDFGDLPVFHGITTYPCIVTVRNAPPSETFMAAEPEHLAFNDLETYVREMAFPVRSSGLDPEGWTLVSTEVQALLEKLRSAGTPLDDYVDGKIYRGVLTGLNEAFVINREQRDALIAEDPRSAEVINPFLAGRDIKRYMPPAAENWLILFPNGWTRATEHNPLEFTEEQAWNRIKQNYPAIANHLSQFEEKARKRYDQGQFWWELRACDYYQEFEKGKIIYAEIASKGQFTLDFESNFSDTTSYIIPLSSEYLLGILNSKLWTFMFGMISSEIRGGFLRWKRQYMQQLPIHTINQADSGETSIREEIVERVERVMALNREGEERRRKFLRLLGSEFALEKFSKKIEAWSELSWEEFEKEMKKAKVKMSLPQRGEWLDYFEKARAEMQSLAQQASRLDGEIDDRVCTLYGLTERERRIVQGSVV